jgi:transposase
MITIKFTEKVIDKLFEEFDKNEHNRVRKKMLAIYLKALGLQHQDIERICRISRPTLSSYLKEYKEHGIKKIKEVNFNQPKSVLMEHTVKLKKYFEAHPPISSNEAREKIKELTGIERSPTQIRKFIKNIGMKIRKVGFVPGNSDTPEKQKEQEEFKKKR